jgi:hypothetical protein
VFISNQNDTKSDENAYPLARGFSFTLKFYTMRITGDGLDFIHDALRERIPDDKFYTDYNKITVYDVISERTVMKLLNDYGVKYAGEQDKSKTDYVYTFEINLNP